MKRYIAFVALTILALVASACGGGQTAAPPAPTTGSNTVVSNTITQPTAPTTGGGAAPTSAPGEPAGLLAQFENAGDSRDNVVVFDLTALPAPASGVLVAWLTDDGGTPFKLGPAQAGTQNRYQDPEGRNLLGQFSGAIVSNEASDQVNAPSTVVLRGALPPSLLSAMRELIVAAATPNGLPFDPGLKIQAQVLAEHGALMDDAAKAGDLSGMRQHAEHVTNITVGQLNEQFGDLDGNGATENPGDGFGVAEYANAIVALLDPMIESPDASERVKFIAREMRQCAVNARNYATDAVGQAKTILAATDPGSVLANTDQVKQITNAAFAGFDQNGNGQLEYIALECGATQVYLLAHALTAVELKAP